MTSDHLLEVDDVGSDDPGNPVVAWLRRMNFPIPSPLPSNSVAYELLRAQYEKSCQQETTQGRLLNLL